LIRHYPKCKIHRLVYYESYEPVMSTDPPRKAVAGWRREKKIALVERSLSGTWRRVGPRKRFRGTISQENALNQHYRRHILGMHRLCVPPASGNSRAAQHDRSERV